MLFTDIQEFVYQGRYTLLALALFAWIGVIVVQEWLRDRATRRAIGSVPAMGPGVFDDPLLGPTMADGGEKADKAEHLPSGPTD